MALFQVRHHNGCSAVEADRLEFEGNGTIAVLRGEGTTDIILALPLSPGVAVCKYSALRCDLPSLRQHGTGE